MTTELNPLNSERGLDYGLENRHDKIAIQKRIETMPNELARKIFRRMEDKVAGGPTDETTLDNRQLAAATVSYAEQNDEFVYLRKLISPEFSSRLVAEGNSPIGAGPTVFPPQDGV